MNSRRRYILEENQLVASVRAERNDRLSREATARIVVGRTLDECPDTAELCDARIFLEQCQSGEQVAKRIGVVAGILAADKACGEDNPLIADIEKQGTPNKLPPRPFLDMGVHARSAWDLYANRDEA